MNSSPTPPPASHDPIAERARAAGVPILSGPDNRDTAAYGEPSGGLVRTMFVRDPGGNFVQFDQRVTKKRGESES